MFYLAIHAIAMSILTQNLRLGKISEFAENQEFLRILVSSESADLPDSKLVCRAGPKL